MYSTVKITAVDMRNGVIEGYDYYKQRIVIYVENLFFPYLNVPEVGDTWVVQKIGNYWRLEQKAETGREVVNKNDLVSGDVRIESRNILYVNADQEIIMDFAKADASLQDYFEQTQIERFNVKHIVMPVADYLPTEGVVDGQYERIRLEDDDDSLIWNFRYSEVDGHWDFAGGAAHVHFNADPVTNTGTAWLGTAPSFTIPYDGVYIVSGGAEMESTANNTGLNLGLSVNGLAPIDTLSAFSQRQNKPVALNSTLKIEFLRGDTLKIQYRKDPDDNPSGTATFFNRWLQLQPQRVYSDPTDEA